MNDRQKLTRQVAPYLVLFVLTLVIAGVKLVNDGLKRANADISNSKAVFTFNESSRESGRWSWGVSYVGDLDEQNVTVKTSYCTKSDQSGSTPCSSRILSSGFAESSQQGLLAFDTSGQTRIFSTDEPECGRIQLSAYAGDTLIGQDTTDTEKTCENDSPFGFWKGVRDLEDAFSSLTEEADGEEQDRTGTGGSPTITGAPGENPTEPSGDPANPNEPTPQASAPQNPGQIASVKGVAHGIGNHIITKCGNQMSKTNAGRCADSLSLNTKDDAKVKAALKASAVTYKYLQCVGFVNAFIAGMTGESYPASGHAKDRARSHWKFRFVAAPGPPQAGDLAVWYGNTRNGTNEDDFGHIGVVSFATSNAFQVTDANYGCAYGGCIRIDRDADVREPTLAGFLRMN